MATSPEPEPEPDTSTAHLLRLNAPWLFWRLLDKRVSEHYWHLAAHEALSCLAGVPGVASAHDIGDLLAEVLGEGQFGAGHWRLSPSRRAYYDYVRPLLPPGARSLLRHLLLRKPGAHGPSGWPVEDRYVHFQLNTVGRALKHAGLGSAPYLHFWPHGKRFALVLTHDIESQAGETFVRDLAALEERYGFRSSFNFVAEQYPVDRNLQEELQERGFEVGVHGLKHDGRLFSSEQGFREQARRINGYARQWHARGFRSPMTHRQPEWMQALDVEYDSSFFDTDPFEPIPGGTLSIWPFMLGHLVELPYTLCQDHTLLSTLGERGPRLWIQKLDFIERYCGMALLNTHPDYLLKPAFLGVYEEFLEHLRTREGHWHALPRDVARWWRARMRASAEWTTTGWQVPDLPEARVGLVRRSPCGEGVDLGVEGGTADSNPAPAWSEYAKGER